MEMVCLPKMSNAWNVWSKKATKSTHQYTQKYIHGWKLLPSTRPVVIRRVLTNECSTCRWNEMNRDRERDESFVQKENGNRTCQTEAKYLVEAIFHTAIIRYLGHRVNSKKLKMKISFKGFYKWQLLHSLFMFCFCIYIFAIEVLLFKLYTL